ncbi:WXG100 family type VII secretion target [Streptomyces sp. CB02923]|uniref:WXG100 family type VII secretion target n=1 Tax=Streptomyces sp. CB02923 TaxID=1718985 RepID=UPI0009A11E19|nr:WXG100 family type VII secretion target [Streptomyces sp. CB02923]
MTERHNPQALHEAAAGWRDMGKHLDGLVRDLDRHVGLAAAANWHGPAGEAFAGEWHRLKQSVDETLPVFELAAADLENAASQDKGAHAGADSGAHDAAPAASQNDGSQSSGMQTAYGFMALGQLATSLGGVFRGKGGKGGQGQRPPLTATWETSGAPQGPDPFGPPRAGDPKGVRGGAGVAKGVRTGESEAEGGGASEGTPKAAAGKAGSAPSSDADAASPASEKTASGSEKAAAEHPSDARGQSGTGNRNDKGAKDQDGKDTKDQDGKGEGGPGEPSPDVRRHGAFG